MKRYTVGPTVEVRLPFGFRFEADALYRRVRQDTFAGPAPTGNITVTGMRSNVWEVPLLLKRPFVRERKLAPFVSGGATLRHIGDFAVDMLTIPTFPGFSAIRQQFTQASNEPVHAGITVAGGLRMKARFLRIEPELRYTHWTSKHLLATQEQLDLLVGFSFP
jgi:hypothetical protein